MAENFILIGNRVFTRLAREDTEKSRSKTLECRSSSFPTFLPFNASFQRFFTRAEAQLKKSNGSALGVLHSQADSLVAYALELTSR